LVCSASEVNKKTFHVDCYHEWVFAAEMRRAALASQLGKPGQTADAKVVDAALTEEIKAGKVKLPDHSNTGFRMAGPISGYDAATNTVSSQIKSWQMIIIPFVTGANLSLPEKPTPGMPWVMQSGTWISHVMVEH
jgi:hypothetical protein